MSTQTVLAELTAACNQHGLLVRGGFVVANDDRVPQVATSLGARRASHLLLVGNAGSTLWRAFAKSREHQDGAADPLNRWSRRIAEQLAAQFNARVLFPFGAPTRPFLAWAKKAEHLHNSHLGMLIHPHYGLWHAYRFALAFADEIELPSPPRAHACACNDCADKPCRPACPVGAFGANGYDLQKCCAHLNAHADSPCMQFGCQARMACPQGETHRYAPPHAQFHMRAFVDSICDG